MGDKKFKAGELVWICIWEETNKKFLIVCGTFIQYINNDWCEVMTCSNIFKRKISSVNKFKDKNKFIPWPFSFRKRQKKQEV